MTAVGSLRPAVSPTPWIGTGKRAHRSPSLFFRNTGQAGRCLIQRRADGPAHPRAKERHEESFADYGRRRLSWRSPIHPYSLLTNPRDGLEGTVVRFVSVTRPGSLRRASPVVTPPSHLSDPGISASAATGLALLHDEPRLSQSMRTPAACPATGTGARRCRIASPAVSGIDRANPQGEAANARASLPS